jgi:hypothetical protein
MVFTVGVSYLEIYNEVGFDLLEPRHDVRGLDDLPKVKLMEDGGGQVSLHSHILRRIWAQRGDGSKLSVLAFVGPPEKPGNS